MAEKKPAPRQPDEAPDLYDDGLRYNPDVQLSDEMRKWMEQLVSTPTEEK